MTKRARTTLLALSLSLLSACNEPERSTPAPASKGLQSIAALEAQAPARRRLDIQAWQTEQGARVLFVAAPELAMFDLRLTFAAGSSQDGDKPGVALLTNAMLNEGIPGKDATAIAASFEDLGAEFSNGAYRDMAVVGLRALSAEPIRNSALQAFLPLLQSPTFEPTALARVQNQLLTGFEFDKQNPAKLAQLALFEALYGEHPYAHPSEGTHASVSALTPHDLKAFYQKAYSAPNAVIALVGDLTLEQAQAIAADVSKALPQGERLAKMPTPATPKPMRKHIEFASKQTHLQLATLGIERGHADYAALYLGNQILGGGGFGSRLMEEVREKRGLTYGIYSGFSPMQARGPFTISLQTRAEQSEGTLNLVKSVLNDFLEKGPSQTELNNAKRELAGSFPLSTASNESIVGQLGSMGFYDLPLTWLEDFLLQVQNLTTEQVQQAMQRHLDPEQLIIVSVGPTVEQAPLPEPTPSAPVAAMPEH